jgi:signal transduction histidine kinase
MDTEPHDEASCVDALWLATLHRVFSRAAHEVKGALNGVSVNLEVVRSRSEKPDAPASAVRQYAASASGQLEGVIEMSEALLALGRPVREPVEMALMVRRFAALLEPVAKADSRRLELDGSLELIGLTSAAGNVVRLSIGATLLAAIEASAHVRCTATRADASATLRIESCDRAPLAIEDVIVSAAAGAGIKIQAEPSAISISFPR